MKKQMMMSFVFVAGIVICNEAEARENNRGQKLAVSQGISSPTSTSPVNFSHGFTYNNSAVASQLQDIHLTLEADTSSEDDNSPGPHPHRDNTGYGGELGVGNGNVGISLGYYKRDCEGDACDGRVGGIVGAGGESIAVGVGYREENNYSAGLLFNPKGKHRFGIVADMYKDELLDDSDFSSYGAGYSYVGNSFTFAVDASKRDYKQVNAPYEDIIMVTPGLEVHSDWLALSVSYDTYLNDDDDSHDDDVWLGVGINGKNWNLAVYHDYVNEWSAALTFWF